MNFLQAGKTERKDLLVDELWKLCFWSLWTEYLAHSKGELHAADKSLFLPSSLLFVCVLTLLFSLKHRLCIIVAKRYLMASNVFILSLQVIQKSGQLPRAKVVDDLVWAQWDMMEQRLFYIVPKVSWKSFLQFCSCLSSESEVLSVWSSK